MLTYFSLTPKFQKYSSWGYLMPLNSGGLCSKFKKNAETIKTRKKYLQSP